MLIDQIGDDQDLQRAYAVHIKSTDPFAHVVKEWWYRRQDIRADRTGAPVPVNGQPARKRWGSLIYELFRGGDVSETARAATGATVSPEVDIFHTYILDPSVNETGQQLHTDDFTITDPEHFTKGTTWEYEVPFLGQPVPTGRMIPGGGGFDSANPDQPLPMQLVPEMRPATRAEAALYPNRRLIIWCNSAVLYDGPSEYVHGQVPVIPFKLDEWPWEYLGFSVIAETLTLNHAVNNLVSDAVQQSKLRLNPPISYSLKEYAKRTIDLIRWRKPGVKVGKSGLINDPVKPIFPYQHYEMPVQLVPFLQFLMETQDHVQGVSGYESIMKLNQLPSEEGIQKILDAIGPLVADQARMMERSLTLLGFQWMWNIFQFDTTRRRIQILGEKGLVDSDFNYDPGDFTPEKSIGIEDFGRARRIKAWGQRFNFSIVPNSSFNITDMNQKLLYLQLWRDPKNFPIDPWTIAEVFNLPNFGEAPADTIWDRNRIWQDFIRDYELNKAIEAQTQMGVAQLQLQQYAALTQLLQDPRMGAMMSLLSAAGVGSGDGSNGSPNGGSNGSNPFGTPQGSQGQEGRRPTASAPPSLEQKSDLGGRGPRSTVKES